MSILKAEKVIIAGLQSSQEYLLKRLQKEGLVHIETLKESKSQPELTLLRELEEAIKFLSLYEEKKSFFQKVQEVFSLNREDLYKERDFFEESGLVKKMLALKKELLKIREERKNKERELSQIQDFLFFDFSLKNLEFKEISWLVLSEERERIISLLEKGVKKELNAEFYVSVTRPPSVYSGNPFIIEVALAYGGDLPKENSIKIMRFANRVPLLYQQGACAFTKSIIQTNWKAYGLSQSSGSIPIGPVIILIHIASVWAPYTSEAKEAIAHYPEIIKEVKLALQEVGRK